MPSNIVSRKRDVINHIGAGFVVLKPIPIIIERRLVRYENRSMYSAKKGEYYFVKGPCGLFYTNRNKRNAIKGFVNSLINECDHVRRIFSDSTLALWRNKEKKKRLILRRYVAISL